MGEHDGHRDRLRKRFLEQGLDTLQDDQVLELLLFYALPRRDTNALARRLLQHFGSISAVLDAPLRELQSIEGIGDQAALLLHLIAPLSRRYQLSRQKEKPLLDTLPACGEYLMPYFFGATEERIYLLCLDAKCRATACRLLQVGDLNSAAFSIRKLVETAIDCKACSVVLSHNHTNGMPMPSRADINTTLEVQAALRPLGIALSDHVIVADNSYVSMVSSGFFTP